MAQKTISVKVPAKRLVRIKRKKPRLWIFDFRGIRNHPPTQKELQNLLGLRHAGYYGEKPAFTSPEVLQKNVDEYFMSCYEPVVDRAGRLVRDDKGEIVKVQKRPFTVSGLAYHIGVSTDALNRYCRGVMDDLGEEDDNLLYSTILQRAKQRIEFFVEESLYSRDSQPGARFVLDSHFNRTTQKEKAEIFEKLKNIEMKQKEFELKKNMSEEDTGDGTLTINIVRKEKDSEEVEG